MIWCWNPVIDVKDVSILTNDRRWWWRNATQWCYSWCTNKTNDFTYDVMLWSRPTKPQTMMLRYQSTMLNSDQLCYRRRWYFESDQWCHAWQRCFNPAQRCYGQWWCYLTWSREWKQGSKTLIPGSRNGAGIKGKANVKKRNELNFNYSELP